MTDFSKTEINIDKKDYSNYRILIVSTSWNREIIDVMQEDAISELQGFNVNHIDSIEVPGAFELSQAAEKFISSYDAVLALGTIIKGETYHFEVLAHETARSLSQVGISNKKPVIFGVLTTDNELQAKQRAEVKGSEYAKTLLMMIDLFSKDATS
jgi:6,7-dimethyl-8-ribityllumazine synthase